MTWTGPGATSTAKGATRSLTTISSRSSWRRAPTSPATSRSTPPSVDPDDLAGLPLRHRRRVHRPGLFPGPYSPQGLGEAAKYVRPALTTGMAKNAAVLAARRHRPRRGVAGRSGTGRSAARGRAAQRCRRTRRRPAVRLVIDESGVHGVVRVDGTEHTVRAASGFLLPAAGGGGSPSRPPPPPPRPSAGT